MRTIAFLLLLLSGAGIATARDTCTCELQGDDERFDAAAHVFVARIRTLEDVAPMVVSRAEQSPSGDCCAKRVRQGCRTDGPQGW